MQELSRSLKRCWYYHRPLQLQWLHVAWPRAADRDKPGTRRTPSPTPSESNFSVWSDSGDIADQLANEEDPLRLRLRGSLDLQVFGKSGQPNSSSVARPKRVRYEEDEAGEEHTPFVDNGDLKEAIRIPEPGPRTISRAERLLASIMSPRDGRAKTHGLVGKPLLYVTFPLIFTTTGYHYYVGKNSADRNEGILLAFSCR